MLDNIHEIVRAVAAVRGGLGELVEIEREVKGWHNQEIGILVESNDAYPQLLKSIYKPPPLLFYKGNVACLSDEFPKIAIVGSRRADSRGCELAKDFGDQLAASGNCVVSGLALGIDSAAHRGALNCKRPGVTIAVLGHGFRYLYPALNRVLAQEILDSGGLLLSQFEPHIPPLPHQFLARNRVIAGISLAVMVVQATAKSGSLATARFGLEEGREVLVIPGDISDPRYEGSNKLIQQGAHIVCKLEDIFDLVPGLKKAEQAKSSVMPGLKLSELSRAILSLLKTSGAVQMERFPTEILKHPAFSRELLELEFDGKIERLPGNFVRLQRAACI